MKNLIRLFITIVIVILAACSTIGIKSDKPIVKRPAKILLAQGYGRFQNSAYLTIAQNNFAIEQAAKSNAYRELAKQLYKVRLGSGQYVADQVLKDESFRIYMDLFMREAKVVESKAIADLKRVKLALNLSPRFFYCISTTPARARQCLDEDNKVQYTRIGYRRAPVSTVKLSCQHCSSQVSISGFSAEKNAVDKSMLSVGLYDSEWGGNMAVSAMIRYLYLTQFIFN